MKQIIKIIVDVWNEVSTASSWIRLI